MLRNNINFYLDIGMAAIQSRQANAWRLWRLANSYDEAGSGKVDHVLFRKWVLGLGVTERTYWRWLRAARKAGFIFEPWEGMLGMVNAGKVAEGLGLATVGDKRCQIKTRKFTGSNFRAYVVVGATADLSRPVLLPEPVDR